MGESLHHANMGDLFPERDAAVYGFDLQDPADADVVEHPGAGCSDILRISAFTLDRLLRDELTHELRRSPAWRGGRLRRTPTAKWKKSKCEDAILL